MITYTGTSASETLNLFNWNYNWNVFNMGDGDDRVTTPTTGVAYTFFGGRGNDSFIGDSGVDTALGGDNNDNLHGWGNNDYMRGDAGDDILFGDSGRDIVIGDGGRDDLYGGTEQDSLWGGTDYFADYFHVAKGESNAIVGQHDIIYDWNRAYDYIDTSLKGTSTNYTETWTTGATMANVRAKVEHSSFLSKFDHVFLYNEQTDTGYLLSDLDSNYTFETGVEIKGAGSAYDMNWFDIV